MLRGVSGEDNNDKDPELQLGRISFGIGHDAQPVTAPDARGEPPKATATTSAQGAPAAVEEAVPLLPLRVILVADLVPRGEFNAGAEAPEQAVRIDPTDFDLLFKKLRPRASIEVESVLAQGSRARVELAPTAMKSFRPDGLCREIPLLRSLLDGKRVLERLRDGTTGVDSAASELARLWQHSPFARQVLDLVDTPAEAAPVAARRAEPEPSPPSMSAGRILDMVDTGTAADADAPISDRAPAVAPETPQSEGRFGAFIEAVAKSASKGRPGARPDEGIRRIEKALSLQLGVILQHPEVRRLEQAWRGLHFLVDRCKPHGGIRLELISARPDEAAEALDRAIRANASVEPPVSFAAVDDCIDGAAPSLARLRALSEVAEAHTVPLITNGSAGIFGLHDLAEADRLDNKAKLYEAPERAPWRSLTQQLSTRWVSVAMNRILARKGYDSRSSRVREATVEELPGDEASLVWIEPCWGVATLMLHSFRKSGWPCRITGARNGGTIENLPVREVRIAYEGNELVAIPTEVMISVDTQRILARYGVLSLATMPNTDEAYVISAPTTYVTPPKRTYDSDTTEPEVRLPRVSLVDQLFVARVVQFLRALGAKIPPGSDPAQVRPVMEAALWQLFEAAPPAGPEIQLQVQGSGAAESVAVTIRPRRYLGVNVEEVSLEIPLG